MTFLRGRELLVQDGDTTVHRDLLLGEDDTAEADRALGLAGYDRTSPWHRHPVATWWAEVASAKERKQ